MITCTFEDGGTGKLRHAVVDNIIIKNDKILMVKRAERLNEGGKWAFPAGFIGRDETSLQAAAREAMEETGYDITGTKLFMIKDNPNRPGEDRQNISFVFVSQPGEQTGESDDESDDAQWLPLDNLPPKEQIAFDHFEIIERYREYLAKEFPLPIFD